MLIKNNIIELSLFDESGNKYIYLFLSLTFLCFIPVFPGWNFFWGHLFFFAWLFFVLVNISKISRFNLFVFFTISAFFVVNFLVVNPVDGTHRELQDWV